MSEVDELRRRVDELTFQLADASHALRTMAEGQAETTSGERSLNPFMLLDAQDAMQRSERLMRSIFDGALNAIVLIDREGLVVDANSAACELFCRPRESLPRFPFVSLSSDPLALKAKWRQLFEQGQGRGAMEVVRPDGSLRQTEYSATSNVLPGVDIVLLRDVTERKDAEASLLRIKEQEEQLRLEAEQRLRESEERYRRIVETTSEGVLTTDELGHITFVNQHMADMLGYTRDEMVGHPVFAFFDEESRITGKGMFERRRRGLRDVYEQRYRHKDGREVWTLVSATPLINAQGKFEGTIGMITDVTERRRERAESEALFGLSLDLMCVSSLNGQFTRVNPSFERILGYSTQEILSRPLFDFVHPDDLEKTRAELATLHAGKPSLRFENRYRCKDGSYRVLSWSSVPADGVAYAVARDVTEQRALEEQLRQAQKMEAVGNLAGGIAHDFNNLLSVMLGYTSLALDDLAQDAPLRADLVQIEKAARRAEALTRQLLAFSRRQILEPQVVDLNQSVKDLGQMWGRLLGEHIELVLDVERPIGRVYADPGQIEQVLMNLVVNARDAMAEGGKLSIATADVVLDDAYVHQHHGVAPGRYVMLTVSDNGSGMSDATMARIFEPFFTTKEKGKGTGLGLSTVYGIVKQSGGHIAVTSELGEGTTFKVYLPRSDKKGTASSFPRPVTATLRGHETILLVEDDDAVRMTMRAILTKHGYHILEASDGGDALRVSEGYAGKIDLLLTDVVMPRMNGRQLAERLLPTRPQTKVLYVSGYTDDAIVQKGVLVPGIAYLPKPVIPDVLARKLREMLDAPAPDAWA